MSRDSQTMIAAVERFLDRPGSITGIDVLSTGHSNETYLLRGLDLILRTPPSGPGLLPPYDMRRQHDVLAEVRRVAPRIPVPAVHGVCEDATELGAPFYLCEKVPGEAFKYEAPDWLATGGPEFRRALCAQWIDAVAELHCCAPLESLGPVRWPEEEFGFWRDRAAANGGDDGRDIAAVFDRLAQLGFPRSGEPVPVHADPKIGNTMWCDGRLTGLLDWEMAHNGEPLLDLGYMLCWFPGDIPVSEIEIPAFFYFAWDGMYSRSDVIAAWEQRTGRSARGAEVYEAASWAKLWAILHHGATAYETGAIPDERMAMWGQILPLLRARTEAVVASLAATPS